MIFFRETNIIWTVVDIGTLQSKDKKKKKINYVFTKETNQIVFS